MGTLPTTLERKAHMFKKAITVGGTAFLMAGAPITYADWLLCNRTPSALYTAIAFDNGNGYVSTGWYRVGSCGGCRTVYHGRPKLSGVFVRAVSEDRAMVWEDNFLFCVNPTNAFTYSGAANQVRGTCEQQGGTMQAFTMQTLNTGNHTTNFTGRHPSGQICFD